jgi:uncharacterized membrane protein HdeD (DUF308 family)
MALAGAASLIWGVLLIIWPLIGAVVLTWWIAAYAVIFGVVMLVLAEPHRVCRRLVFLSHAAIGSVSSSA